MSDYLKICIIILLFAVISFYLGLNQKFTYDQLQMLLKGFHAAFTGEYLPFGNEASTMGNLPGQLSSWVIGFPLTLSMNAYSPLIFMIVVRCVAVLIFANALSLLFNSRVVIFGTIIYAFSPWLLIQGMLFNPAFIPLGGALILNMLIRLRYERDKRDGGLNRFICSILLMLGLGFCMQLHFSWPLIVILIGMLWLRRDIKVSYIGIFIGIALVAASLIPYFKELTVNHSLLNNPEPYAQDRYIGYGFVHVYPIFKGILYWLRFASLLITKKAIVPEITDDFSTLAVVVTYAWIGISTLVGVITVLVVAFSNYFAIFNFRLGNSSSQLRFVRGFTISALVAVIVVSGLNTLTLNYWQIAIALPFALIPLLAFLSVRHNLLKPFAILYVVFYIFAIPLLMTYSNNYNYKEHYQQNFYRQCLVGFSKEQCAPFSDGLDSATIDAIQSSQGFSQSAYDRIVRGIIPLPDNAVKSKDDEAKANTEAPKQDTKVEDTNENQNDVSTPEEIKAQNNELKQEPLVPESTTQVVDKGSDAAATAATAAAATAASAATAAAATAASAAVNTDNNAASKDKSAQDKAAPAAAKAANAKADAKATNVKNNTVRPNKASNEALVPVNARSTAPSVKVGKPLSADQEVKEANFQPITTTRQVERADAVIELNSNNKAVNAQPKVVDKGDGSASGELKIR